MNGLVYRQSFKLLADDVTMFRKLRPSVLFRRLQEISIAHTEELGFGRSKTLDKGALWVLTRVRLECSRFPEYDERVELSTWPGEAMHVIFPRYYELKSESGESLIRGSAMWLLMDAEKRRMAFPENYGVDIPGTVTGREISLPVGVRVPKTNAGHRFEAKFSSLDINGHMNNAKYLDLMEDRLGADFLGKREIQRFEIDFKSEITGEESVSLCEEREGNEYALGGLVKGKACFALKAEFKDKEKDQGQN